MSRSGERTRAKGKTIFLRFMLGVFIVGLIWSQKQVMLFTLGLSPITILLLIYASVFFLSYFTLGGLPYGGGRFGVLESLGVAMIVYAFNMVFTHITSPWAYAGNPPGNVPPMLYASEDGVVYLLIYDHAAKLPYPILFWKDAHEFTAFLTYAVAPVLIVFLASLLLTPKKASVVRRVLEH
ncbi:MAG: hypothetical protein QXW42_04145 [Thermofilum sp.]